MNWKTWLKGFLSAALTGGATGAGQVISTTGHVNLGTAVVAGIGALGGLINYLIQSPLVPPAQVSSAPSVAPSK
jgi:hypothetical protein